MTHLNRFREQVLEWPGVSIHPHRFGGTEFRYDKAEIGHVHNNGILDIPMPRAIHDTLLEQGLAEQHRWMPDSGWITYYIRSERELQHGLWLARISYLRYMLKTSHDPRVLFERESETLQLSPPLVDLLEKFVPAAAGS
jgi:hypothetical protein